jgi:hypothetical protein
VRPTLRTRRTRSSLTVALVGFTALLAAACGGGGGGADAKSNSASKARPASAEPSTAVAPGDAETTPTTQPPRTVGAAAAPTDDKRVNVSTGLPVKASLSSLCVRPGDKQTVTVDIGQEGGVAYNAYYADGKSGGMDGYYGGNSGGSTDKAGHYSDTWVVAPTAPPGPVLVDVVAIARSETFDRGQTHVNFAVAKPNGSCD